jgi:hypothetical protein
MVKFRTTVLQSGKNTAGFQIPDEIVEELGAGKKPPVKVTINDSYTYRTSIAVMGGVFMMSLSAENRAKSGVNSGDEVDLEVVVDTEPRKMVVPDDLAAALDADPEAKKFFESLSYSNQRRHIDPIEQAKSPETRQRRIEKSVSGFHDGKV